MVIAAEDIMQAIGAWFWPFTRIAALFMALPVLSARLVPARVRIVLAALIAVLIAPMAGAMPQVDPLSAAALFVTAQQILIGVFMGFVIELAFQSVMFGAQAAGLSMGLGFASLVDPQNGVQTGMPGQLFMLLMTLLYLATDTHLALIALLGESFQVVPVGMDGLTRHGFGVLFGWTAEVFQSGFRIALPALVALTLVNVAFGVVTRAAPQLNIFGVGFPITLVLGIVILWAAIEVLPPLFGELLDGGIETVGMALETP